MLCGQSGAAEAQRAMRDQKGNIMHHPQKSAPDKAVKQEKMLFFSRTL